MQNLDVFFGKIFTFFLVNLSENANFMNFFGQNFGKFSKNVQFQSKLDDEFSYTDAVVESIHNLSWNEKNDCRTR